MSSGPRTRWVRMSGLRFRWRSLGPVGGAPADRGHGRRRLERRQHNSPTAAGLGVCCAACRPHGAAPRDGTPRMRPTASGAAKPPGEGPGGRAERCPAIVAVRPRPPAGDARGHGEAVTSAIGAAALLAAGRYAIFHAGIEVGVERWAVEPAADGGAVARGEQVLAAPHPLASELDWRARLTREGRIDGLEI